MRCTLAAALASVLFLTAAAPAADAPAFTRQQDVIYGRKQGTALTLDVFTPKQNANGLGLISVISGGWFSNHDSINEAFVSEFLKRGYTVFAVVHGSQPRYTVPEILEDMHRAVRFIRYHAKDYKIDPDRLGIYGGSAGGHLSLMQGHAGTDGNPNSPDPVERMSSRVQCVACFFPPTDFLNWGKPGYQLDSRTIPNPFKPALAFREVDTKTLIPVLVTDEKKITETCRRISPITHVGPRSAPTLIIHGDKDRLVPFQQAEVMIEKLQKAGVPAKLIVRKDADHGWPTLLNDLSLLADWFDEHLKQGAFTRQRDVIYGRKFGTALTMDVFTPKESANGAGVIFCVSGGWFSSPDSINLNFYREFLRRGYTVFAVVHGSQPKFNIQEILQDMHRAVRFIRYHAKDYKIDPDRLGIAGGSAGGHLSLMQGVGGADGDPKAADPVDRVSSRVQAVACIFPPTDFLNWGEKDHLQLGRDTQIPVRGAFEFYEVDGKTQAHVPVTDEAKLKEIGRKISPIYGVTKDTPPTLIVSGGADKLVPLQQSEVMLAKLKDAGVEADLIIKPDGGHDLPMILFALPKLADWFDKHLAKKGK